MDSATETESQTLEQIRRNINVFIPLYLTRSDATYSVKFFEYSKKLKKKMATVLFLNFFWKKLII